jgi:hypothetical protein
MAWIKRNLFFLIGSLIAVGLMVMGIFYLLGQINEEHQITDDIEKQYAELTRLAGLKPNPGNAKIDNIKAAKDQEATLRNYLKRERAVFEPIASIPDTSTNKISNADFARELRNTVAELRRSAEQQSVNLPPDYYFTFEAQKKSLIFEPGTLDLLASHLGEIKALCDILFAAKINFLDGVQREIVSTNQDSNLPDYLQQRTVSTPLADLTPYRVTIRCFSAELAQVLANLATSPYGFLVQTINVEPVNAVAEEPGPGGGPGQPPHAQPQPGRRPGYPPPAAVPPAGSSQRTVTFLNEKPIRVTLLIQLVKPKPELVNTKPTSAVKPRPVAK